MHAPKYERSEYLKRKPADNAPQLEKDRFWEQEKQYWLEGDLGLTNFHYFFLTQCRIKNAIGEEIYPFWRDVDDLIFGAYQDAINKRKDLLIAKRREVGLTTIFGGVI